MSKKKTTTTPTPHDAAFRSFLANPDVARDFLELHLPAEYRQLCDLSTLKLEPATFVEPDLHQYASDILWSVKTTGGEDGYVYTLIEHQSTENLYMPFRMLRYSVAAMQRHLEQHKTLPLVIPVLFYHGERSPYPYSMNWLDCFENPALAAKIYTKPFPLVDITVVDDNEIMNHRRMAALTLLMKHICVFRSIRSRIGIEVRSAIRIHSINRELNFFYRFLTRFFAAFHYRGIFPQ